MQETANARSNDFIGLYFANDEKVSDPWNWEAVNSTLESSLVLLQANKAGDMEIRLVRPPNQILARVSLKVHAPCTPLCYRHGSCVRGACVCNIGYALPDCSSPDATYMSIEAFDKDMEKEFQAGFPITAKLVSKYPLDLNGKDYVGVYPAKSPNGTTALSWKPFPSGNVTSVDLRGVKVPGEYVLRFTRFKDLAVIAESKPFTVYEFCPNQCSNHGKCIGGKCRCNEPWSTADCSFGPGLVNLTVTFSGKEQLLFKNEEVTVKFTRVNDPDHTHLGDADWIGLFGADDNSTAQPFAYQYAQAQPSEEDDEFQAGNVTFNVPPSSPAFVFKYFRNDHVLLTTTDVLHVHQPCVPVDCNKNGVCVEGQCQCFSGWTGAKCDVGDVDCSFIFEADNLQAGSGLDVTFVRGVGTGTENDFVGLYSSTETNPDNLYDWARANGTVVPIANNTIEGVIRLTPPIPGFYNIRLMDIYTKRVLCTSLPFQVYQVCPRACSKHGKCVHGECQCDSGWLSPDCKRFQGQVVVSGPARVILSNNLFEKTNFTAVLLRPDGWHNPGDFVGLYPMEKEGSPVNVMMVLNYQPAPTQTGSVDIPFNISSLALPGSYRLWYVSGVDYSKIAQSDPIEIVPDCNDGDFNLASNLCECPEGKTGKRCEADTCCFELIPSVSRGHPKDNITVTWSRPHKNGKNVDVIGLYKQDATEFNAPYSFQFADGQDGDSGSVTLALPPVEETFVIHYVSSGSWESKYTGPHVFVTLPCDPEDCSSHGVCIQGKCTCTTGWGGSKCDVTVPSSLQLAVESPGAIPAGSVFSVRWGRTVDVGDKGDYIGIYKRSDANSAPYSFVYVPISKEAFQGTVQITAPAVPGVYQLRWISAKLSQSIISSAEFDVQ
eukprot:c12858_g1_i1.p1 GENE.c12858_g1_i1~~c12858_g1_i1.p1  ORF type:complete len:960 (-),score=235.35 c12858_g1_i1:17-2671(-)